MLDEHAAGRFANRRRLTVTGLPLGRYTIEETIPVPGYDRDPFVATVDLHINRIYADADMFG
ncbi:MAG: hypothetical protein R3C05_01330 [Pirellulaceae bacterium]